MDDYPDDAVEFGRQWSSVAGELSGVKSSIVELERRSGVAFIARRDEVANALRDAAIALRVVAEKLSDRVGGYIKEDGKRRYEMRKVLGH